MVIFLVLCMNACFCVYNHIDGCLDVLICIMIMLYESIMVCMPPLDLGN